MEGNISSVRRISRTRTLVKPTSHIGAQALLNVSECSYSGFLAKRGRRERLIERFNLPKRQIFNDLKKWRKRFVVISQGCLYIYDKNTSNNLSQAFSLAGYNRLSRLGSESNDFPFRLEGRYNGMKEHQFSCESDEERKEWMKQIKEEMCIANGVQPEGNYTDYRILQKPVIDEGNNDDGDADDEDYEEGSYDSDYEQIPDIDVVPRSRMPLPPTPVDRRESGSKSKSASSQPAQQKKKEQPAQQKKKEQPAQQKRKVMFTQNNEEKIKLQSSKETRAVPSPSKEKRAAVPLPEEKKTPIIKEKKKIPLPPADNDETDSAPKRMPKPKPPEKPVGNKVTKATNGIPTEKDYLYSGSNREEAIQKLKKGPPGTFLVRSSRTDDSKVLVVNTPDDVKEFKIYKDGEKVTLDRKTFYKSTQELVETYSKSNLPKRDITLGKGFSSLDLSVI